MPAEIRVWEVGKNGQLAECPRERLDIEARLEDWLAKDIGMLDHGLLVIGRQIQTDFGGIIDLFCINESGDLVVVELKRDKTPREVTAQTLDYASWVDGLTSERLSALADEYLGGKGQFGLRFKEQFGIDLPETLNQDHRLLIVGSQIDASSERIIKYLSDRYGVNINAVTFNYFRTSDGRELMGRVFLLEPGQVDYQTRTRTGSKRRPNLTYEELEQRADENGVGDLYRQAVEQLEPFVVKDTSRSYLRLRAPVGKKGALRTVLRLLPGESSKENGLRFQLYAKRFATLTGVDEAAASSLLPPGTQPWKATNDAGPWRSGFAGFLKSPGDVDRLVKAIERAGGRSPVADVPEAE